MTIYHRNTDPIEDLLSEDVPEDIAKDMEEDIPISSSSAERINQIVAKRTGQLDKQEVKAPIGLHNCVDCGTPFKKDKNVKRCPPCVIKRKLLLQGKGPKKEKESESTTKSERTIAASVSRSNPGIYEEIVMFLIKSGLVKRPLINALKKVLSQSKVALLDNSSDNS